MPFLTLYINQVPVAESIFELPERDKSLTREATHRINKIFLSNKIQELKKDNETRITQAGSEYEIQFSLRSEMSLNTEIPTNPKRKVKIGLGG